ncbi:MAG: Fic family protein [bacterium]|nr:Fic family protein [bacterium]
MTFKPKFRFTPQIVRLLSTIERRYGALESRQLIPSLALRLTQEHQILATHHSTSIEGNPLNPQEVTNILLDDRIPTNKSEQEVKNYFAALNSIAVRVHQKELLKVDFVLKLHAILMDDIPIKDPGKFRNSPVVVGHRNMVGLVIKHNPPVHTALEIGSMVEDVLTWTTEEKSLHPLVVAAILHHQIAFIHPFIDGNGRMARLLTAYYLLLQGYEVTRYFILDDYYDMDRIEYSDSLHAADLGRLNEWITYFLDGISYSLHAAEGRIDQLASRAIDDIEGEKRVLVTRREEDVLQLVLERKAVKMDDVRQLFDVTRQHSHALLSSLVKKGLLVKYGKTKSSYYKLRRSEKTE